MSQKALCSFTPTADAQQGCQHYFAREENPMSTNYLCSQQYSARGYRQKSVYILSGWKYTLFYRIKRQALLQNKNL